MFTRWSAINLSHILSWEQEPFSKEIKSVIDLNEFKTREHEFARDVWVLLYRCNGENFADLQRMKWSQIDGDYIFLTRKKTESTRRNNKKQINRKLKDIRDQFKLSRPLQLGITRDCYASALDRKNTLRKNISQM